MFELGMQAFDAVATQGVDPETIKNPIERAGLFVLMIGILAADAVWSLIFE